MKRIFAVFSLVFGVMLGGVSPVFADVTHLSKAPGTSASPAPEIKSLKGVVSDIQPTSSRMRIKTADGKEWTLTLDASTTVWKANKSAGFSELKTGGLVKVRHIQKDGEEFAKSIEIES